MRFSCDKSPPTGECWQQLHPEVLCSAVKSWVAGRIARFVYRLVCSVFDGGLVRRTEQLCWGLLLLRTLLRQETPLLLTAARKGEGYWGDFRRPQELDAVFLGL